jgi:tetrapyrrole methylase family protein/MazG family protein
MTVSHLTILGLGPGPKQQLTAEAETVLNSGKPLYLRTRVHPLTADLPAFQSFDVLYEEKGDFAAVYQAIGERVLAALANGDLIYAVPGHPMVGEQTVKALIPAAKAAGHTVRVIPGVSALEALYASLALDPSEGMLILDALTATPEDLSPALPTIVLQVYQPRIAGEVKLTLMERYPDDHLVTMVQNAGDPDAERVETVPLSRIDRLTWVDHLTSLYVPPTATPVEWEGGGDEGGDENASGIGRLVDIVSFLRSPEGCPWDQEQTPKSLTRYIIEEAYEVVTAIESDHPDAIEDELGDLLLQVVLQSQIAMEEGHFDFDSVAGRQADKLFRRHPHVFGDQQADDAEEVLVQWEEIKAKERESQASALDGVAVALPALFRADKIQRRAARVGFDWPDIAGIWEKVTEEVAEIQEALGQAAPPEKVADEVGDLLFAVVNVARFLNVEPEEALRGATAKFTARFHRMEALAKADHREIKSLSLDEWDALWNRAKQDG